MPHKGRAAAGNASLGVTVAHCEATRRSLSAVIAVSSLKPPAPYFITTQHGDDGAIIADEQHERFVAVGLGDHVLGDEPIVAVQATRSTLSHCAWKRAVAASYRCSF